MSVVSLNTTLVPVETAALNTAPLLLMRVRVLSGVVCPMVPTTLMAPVLPAFRVNDSVLLVVPLMLPPKVIDPPEVFSMRSPVRVRAVLASPRLIAVLLVAMVPAALMAAGAVATRPPVKVKLSVAELPSTRLPVCKKVVALVTLVVPPNNSRW